MPVTNGDIALKAVGALLAALDHGDPAVVDRMRIALAADAGDPVTDVCLSAVDGIIKVRSRRP